MIALTGSKSIEANGSIVIGFTEQWIREQVREEIVNLMVMDEMAEGEAEAADLIGREELEWAVSKVIDRWEELDGTAISDVIEAEAEAAIERMR